MFKSKCNLFAAAHSELLRMDRFHSDLHIFILTRVKGSKGSFLCVGFCSSCIVWCLSKFMECILDAESRSLGEEQSHVKSYLAHKASSECLVFAQQHFWPAEEPLETCCRCLTTESRRDNEELRQNVGANKKCGKLQVDCSILRASSSKGSTALIGIWLRDSARRFAYSQHIGPPSFVRRVDCEQTKTDHLGDRLKVEALLLFHNSSLGTKAGLLCRT